MKVTEKVLNESHSDTMQKLYRGSTALAYRDNGGPGPELVLIHGWGCDSGTLSRQSTYFERTHRVISVDLRGHGQSDAPEQEYTIENYADDVVWILDQLGIKRAALVGHSMGGAIALEIGYRFPERVNAAVLIDTAFEASSEMQKRLAPLLPGLHDEGYADAYRKVMAALSLETDQPELKAVLSSLPRAPQHVLLSALHGHAVQHAFGVALGSFCRPLAYIAAAEPLADLPLLKRLAPHIDCGQAVGVGHFAPWVAAEQVNSMISRFLAIHRSSTPDGLMLQGIQEFDGLLPQAIHQRPRM